MTLTNPDNREHNAGVSGELNSRIRQHLDDAAEKHSTGRIQVEIIVRDGRVQRTEITPLAEVIM